MGQSEEPLMGQMWEAAQSNRADRARSRERLKLVSRDRLLRIIETKIRTTMIGALAAVEESIGRELWGHGRPERDCTPEELAWRSVWQDRVRPAILNNGNNQLRAMQAEVALYDVAWTGYQNVLPVVDPEAGGRGTVRGEEEPREDARDG